MRPWYPWWNWGRTEQLIAFDVTLPEQPKFASQQTFGTDQSWDVAKPLAANDTVYLGYKVLPSYSGIQPEATNSSAAPAPDEQVNHYFLKLIDYSDSTMPVVADGSIALPGELRGVSRKGQLLYTVGPTLKVTDGSSAGGGRSLQASGFDGTAAHLLDQLPLGYSAQPFLLTGESLLVLHPQPASYWQPYPILFATSATSSASSETNSKRAPSKAGRLVTTASSPCSLH